ncbi:heme biosynthesis HemY N-terminal domain-containing protein [Legionella pneumophila]|uniref:heme biosynthesis HemY N-terminal domain-containing protein n=1 Tax=Legionella pneumophila TaxID=446 RepID=UPI000875DB30|nr:heme biosynthesis HemY N-terminal domain-containing protein [Legionella pneumophila]AOW58841.1 protoporphyrinogen oxidase [Legionella pneumophila subsp. pneumophila]AOW60971.1 protoporphyrinogen oxidase [Legionella pneumophila subsp. pneumophila]AOW66368.1 protoporphyrinogen oxidase [Legionella pneumophila subsp. pneumophila]
MIRVLFAFIILLLSVFLGIQLNKDPGYVLIAINNWTIETTLWVSVFGLFFLFFLIYGLVQLCNKITRMPGMVNKWHSRRLAQKAQATTRKGLIEYSEGYWQKAKNHLIQALPNTDTPLLNYLTAARAAQKMGDSKLRDHYLREAQQSMPEAKIAVELTQAQLQLANHQWEQALATLKHLQDLAPRHPYVLKLLMNLYEEIKDWQQLIALLPDLKKNHIISDQAFEQLQKNTYLQAMIDLAKHNQSDGITKLYQTLPKTLVNDTAITAEYARFLIRNRDYDQAEYHLKRCLRKELDNRLIELYSLLPCEKNQLLFAESLLKKNPHSAGLHLCLGRMCLSRHLWGKAKHYLEQSIELNPTPVAFIELGKLHEKLNDPLSSGSCYKKGLELITKDELS